MFTVKKKVVSADLSMLQYKEPQRHSLIDVDYYIANADAEGSSLRAAAVLAELNGDVVESAHKYTHFFPPRKVREGALGPLSFSREFLFGSDTQGEVHDLLSLGSSVLCKNSRYYFRVLDFTDYSNSCTSEVVATIDGLYGDNSRMIITGYSSTQLLGLLAGHCDKVLLCMSPRYDSSNGFWTLQEKLEVCTSSGLTVHLGGDKNVPRSSLKSCPKCKRWWSSQHNVVLGQQKNCSTCDKRQLQHFGKV